MTLRAFTRHTSARGGRVNPPSIRTPDPEPRHVDGPHRRVSGLVSGLVANRTRETRRPERPHAVGDRVVPDMRRELRVLPVPPGAAVREVFPVLRDVLADRGPALLPVPADDPARTRLLIDAMDPTVEDGPDGPRPGLPIDPRAALVVSTSGSTGTPKGAMLSSAALAASAAATDAALGGPGRWILALPGHHIAGLQVMLRSLRAGHEPVIVDVSHGFDPAALLSAVDSARAGGHRAYLSLVPGQLAKVLDSDDPAPAAALADLDAVLLGGAAAAPDLLARAAAAGIRVVRTYGMSETAGGCVYDGVPLDGVRLAFGDSGDDDEGRVWISGPQLALGYRNAPDHEAFARPGWFRTDDAGRLEQDDRPGSDGRLRILGRLDEALSVGGLTLLPQTLEDALRRHAAVEDVVVVGLPDPRLGTRPVAAVTVRRGTERTARLADELRAHVTGLLGVHSAPRGIAVVEALPLLPGGKVDRRGVAAAFAAGTILEG